MFAHTHIAVLIREHEGKAHLHHDGQRMEIPYDDGKILYKPVVPFRAVKYDIEEITRCYCRKDETQNKTEQPQQKSTAIVKKSVIGQMKTEQKSVPVGVKQSGTKRPPQPKTSVLATKYPRLKEIDDRLKKQNKVIFERENKRDMLKRNYLDVRAFSRAADEENAIAYMNRNALCPDEIVCLDEYGETLKKAFPHSEMKYSFNNPGRYSSIFNTVIVGKGYLRNQEARHRIIDAGKSLVNIDSNYQIDRWDWNSVKE